MDESTPIQLTEIIDKLRIRATGNDKWVNILVQNDTDLRARRIMQLLGEATPKAEAVCALIEQILQICENSQVFHRGYDPYLLSLRQEITEAANYHTEILRRTRLYLQLMAKKESSFSEDILCSMDSAVAEQQELANHLRFESYRLLGTAVSRPPGPAITAFNAQRDTTDLPEVQMRPLFDNKPLPIEDEYDSRWDPDFRVPGSQYGKFLRFHGPFFAPDEEGASTCDNFNLPESAGLIIDACISKYEAVKNNFEETGRLPRKTQQSSIQALVSHQREINLELAKIPGMPYHPDSINLFTRINPRDITSTTRPYLYSAQRVKVNKLGLGIWELEDLNRVLQTQVTRSRDFVAMMDSGRQVFIDRSLNRALGE